MKTSVLVAIVALSLTTTVLAQDAPGRGRVPELTLNCSALKGKPQVCLKNTTDSQVTDIDCETRGVFGGKGSKAVTIPRGGIPARSVTVVDMASCKTALIFTILGGGERRVDHVDTDNMTIIEVPNK